jgi:hypothetical protein
MSEIRINCRYTYFLKINDRMGTSAHPIEFGAKTFRQRKNGCDPERTQPFLLQSLAFVPPRSTSIAGHQGKTIAVNQRSP